MADTHAQVICNDRGRFLSATSTCCVLVGRPVEELQAMGWEDVVHPDDWVIISGAVAQVLAEQRGESTEVVLRVLRPEGVSVWTDLVLARGMNDVGAVTLTAQLQPFHDLFAERPRRGLELMLDAVAVARADRDVIFDAIEDMRTRLIRVAAALSAMAGVAGEVEMAEDDADTAIARHRLSQTMQGAKAMAESVVEDMPELERRPAPRPKAEDDTRP